MTSGLIAEFKRLVPASPEAGSENVLGKKSWEKRLGSDADRQAAAEARGETTVNVKATLSPDDLARACADAMWLDDDASKGLGMEIRRIKPGEATLTMTVQPHMVNGQNIAHGGFIFLLADSAFAFAC